MDIKQVTETIAMIEEQNFDVRTITMGISLLDCIDSDIDKAAEIISRSRSWDTPCGYVKNIGRDEEKGVVCTLKELAGNDDIDMFTTVFIGNSSTKMINGKMVTPRGYRNIR